MHEDCQCGGCYVCMLHKEADGLREEKRVLTAEVERLRALCAERPQSVFAHEQGFCLSEIHEGVFWVEKIDAAGRGEGK